MIRVNLIDAATHTHPTKSPASASKQQNKARSRRPFILILGLIAIIGASTWFYLEQGGKQLLDTWLQERTATVAPQPLPTLPALTTPAPTPPTAAPVATPTPPPAPPAEPPHIVAQAPRQVRPAVPSNGAVEDIVRTVRPESFIKAASTEYRELLPTQKIRYQKSSFFQLLNSIYTITPESVGFLDLAFKAPDYYFIRGMSLDSKAQADFLSRLKTASHKYTLAPSATDLPSPEFTAYGTLTTEKVPSETSPLVPTAELDKEIFALRDLAIASSVKLIGLEKPLKNSYGVYSRVLLRTNTQADFPALLSFANALKQSNLRVGVLQFASRPTLANGMSSSIEFVIYTTP